MRILLILFILSSKLFAQNSEVELWSKLTTYVESSQKELHVLYKKNCIEEGKDFNKYQFKEGYTQIHYIKGEFQMLIMTEFQQCFMFNKLTLQGKHETLFLSKSTNYTTYSSSCINNTLIMIKP